ncbi:MAG: Hsp20/alpha crystallin family protein [Saprospiraceae bacterium]|nr:Hsp20/alpha crystallin family protein [Saprospiraceae bacterium]
MMYSNFYACSPKSCGTESQVRKTAEMKREIFHKPFMNQKEMEDAIELEFSLPGVSKENIKLEWQEQVLTLNATRILNREGMTLKHREFSDRKFKAILRIGDSLDVSSANAQFEHGVLKIKIAKKPIAKISIEVK